MMHIGYETTQELIYAVDLSELLSPSPASPLQTKWLTDFD